MKHFGDQLAQAIKDKGCAISVGLDPRLERLPSHICAKARKENKDPLVAAAEAMIAFNKEIIDAVCDIVPVVKPQIAFYEKYGAEGMRAFQETCKYAKEKGLWVLADAKRNDIGSTATAYAEEFLGEVDVFGETMTTIENDALTVTPYLGWDGVKPFVEVANRTGKGIFVLVKTSNPSSGDFQDIQMADGRTNYEVMGHFVESWGADNIGESGFSNVGAVVGATHPSQAKRLREIMPTSFFLVPGYGAQGGSAEDVKPCFNENGEGALVNSSRGIIFAFEENETYGEHGFAEAAKVATLEMKADLDRLF